MIAVIGGLGYVGRHLVQQLLVMGYRVLVIDKVEDRKLINDLKVFDTTGKNFKYVKLSLPAINTRFKDLLIANKIDTVINVAGPQESPNLTTHLTKYIYCFIVKTCNKVKHYIHTTPMDDNVGYEFVKQLNLPASPENWLCNSVVHDVNTTLKVGVLRLPEGYGHDQRLRYHKDCNLWTKLESIRTGRLTKLQLSKHKVETPDGYPLVNFSPVYDIAGGIIDMMGYLLVEKGFHFAACDIGASEDMSLLDFIRTYEKQYGVKVVLDESLDTKVRTKLNSDTAGGAKLIGQTKIFGDEILHNDILNARHLRFEIGL